MTRRLVVFAREPVSGRVKTRLAEGIGARPAAEAYAALLDHTAAAVRRVGVPWSVSVAEPSRPGWAARLAAEVEVQADGDLGQRMHACLVRWFSLGAQRVVIVGSDIARLSPAHLERALEALDRHPVVLGPATDGGFWLVGQRPPGFDCFSGVPWSTPDTLAATRRRLEALRVRWTEIDALPDVDTTDDLRRAIDDPLVDLALRRRLRAILEGYHGGQ